MKPDAGTARELPALTGLRGVLALWVVLLHISIAMEFSGVPLSEYWPNWLLRLVAAGDWAVDGFFILSGFVLSHVYGELLARPSLRQTGLFLAHRLARIYPVHLALLLAYVVALGVGLELSVTACGHPLLPRDCHRFGQSELLQQFLLVVSWGWIPASNTWNPVAWSVSSEWFGYVCFPVLALLTARIRSGGLAALLAATTLVAMLAALRVAGLGPAFNPLLSDQGLLRLAGCFCCGMLLYRLYHGGAATLPPWSVLAGPSALLLCLLAGGPFAWVMPFLLATLILSLAIGQGVLARLLSTPPLLWLGKISYSLYMCHLFLMEVIGALTKEADAVPLAQQPAWQLAATALGIVATSIMVAALLHGLLEQPARLYLRRLLEKRRSIALARP